MSEINQRNYNCKDEELPIIGSLVMDSLARDLADFSAYSPMFTDEYLTAVRSKSDLVSEMVSPKSEMAELKKITSRIHQQIASLANPVNRLAGYVDMAYPSILISVADFGIVDLRKAINDKEVESVLNNLKIVKQNCAKYSNELNEKGFTPELGDLIFDAYTLIAEDKKLQYSTRINRMNVVYNNLGLLNDFYASLVEVMKVGKILYKTSNPVKLREYTFSEVKKAVRRAAKKEEEGGEPDVPEAK